ncbi:hypothetical protein ACQPWY_24025 [Pseudonocardia xinjiangensis]|uniref:hypothetical protein n=1 Tax=Pseudonocardia xinjiangensis TaxID=75289 RepID=UPI003D89DE43
MTRAVWLLDAFGVVLVGDLTDQFLGDVFGRDHAGQSAVLVEYARELLAALP